MKGSAVRVLTLSALCASVIGATSVASAADWTQHYVYRPAAVRYHSSAVRVGGGYPSRYSRYAGRAYVAPYGRYYGTGYAPVYGGYYAPPVYGPVYSPYYGPDVVLGLSFGGGWGYHGWGGPRGGYFGGLGGYGGGRGFGGGRGGRVGRR